HAPRAQIHVTHFGIAHLPIGQAYMQAGGMHQRVGAIANKGMPMRQACLGDGIVGRILGVSPTIQNQQQYGLGSGHGMTSGSEKPADDSGCWSGGSGTRPSQVAGNCVMGGDPSLPLASRRIVMRRTSFVLSLLVSPMVLAQQDVGKVNGGIRAEAGKSYGNLETVNGSIRLESGASARDVE